jgi:hypothetical protein
MRLLAQQRMRHQQQPRCWWVVVLLWLSWMVLSTTPSKQLLQQLLLRVRQSSTWQGKRLKVECWASGGQTAPLHQTTQQPSGSSACPVRWGLLETQQQEQEQEQQQQQVHPSQLQPQVWMYCQVL